jgi:aldose 1-epimerase
MKTFGGASGVQHEISGHGYRAIITEVGACLRELDYHGRELIVSFGVDEPMVAFRGALAAPWPNRVADGRYTADGRSYQLPINEPSRNCALHGLVFDSRWHLVEHTPSTLVLGLRLPGGEGYPFQLDLTARYEITAGGLTTRIEARNSGSGTAPYGVCPHPYLRAGDSPLDSWTLTLPADRYLRVSPDRLLPVALDDVTGGAFDFRTPREIATTQIDHAFTGLARNDQGLAVVEVREPAGSGVSMSFDAACPWLQIHTADLPDPERTRIGLAVEPMTCPPDAFNSQTDLIRLGPGEAHQASWTITAL